MSDYYKTSKKKPKIIKIRLSPENEKNIGHRIVNVGPGGKETVVEQTTNFKFNKR